jgi:hypothetical protein
MKYTLAAFVNLLTLAVGIAIGILLAPRLERPVHANADPQAAQVNQSPPSTAEPAGPIQVQPGMTIVSVLSSPLDLPHESSLKCPLPFLWAPDECV